MSLLLAHVRDQNTISYEFKDTVRTISNYKYIGVSYDKAVSLLERGKKIGRGEKCDNLWDMHSILEVRNNK